MELKAAYDKKISELKLNTKEQVEPLTDKEAGQLLDICDNKIDNATLEKLVNGANNGKFSSYISSLISKIVLLFGTKNGCLNELKISDYDCKLNKLKINGFWVHLPDKFAIQMRNYMKFREQILGSEEEKLFIDIRKNKRKLDNTKMFYILKGITGNVQAKCIAKYAIIHIHQDYDKRADLEQFFAQEDWENYRIMVHALKSTSLNIGAVELSEQAKALEMAAKSGDTAYVKKHHGEVLRRYKGLCDELNSMNRT